ncbi:hypothetical protein J3F83DRAFT_723469 [Trichoderma novae-zelandiae]
MATKLDEVALTRLFKKTFDNMQRAKRFHLREAQALHKATDDRQQLSQGLRKAASAVMKMSEHLLRVRELAKDCQIDCEVMHRDMERLGLELEDDFLRLLQEDREVLSGHRRPCSHGT